MAPALKKGMQAYNLSVQMTNCDRGKQKKQENISGNGSLGGPEISSVEAHGCIYARNKAELDALTHRAERGKW